MGTSGADIVIAGGGIMGWSAAWWLAWMRGDGRGIVVIEPDPTHARSSTALSAASIRQQFTTEVNIRISRFGIDFIRNIAEWVGEEHSPPGGLSLQENGYLMLATRPEGADVLRAAAALQNGLGADTRLLSPAEITARFPWLDLGDVALASLGARDEGWFDNMGLLAAFRSGAKAAGVVERRDRVTGFEGRRGRGVSRARLASGAALSGGYFINAAGAQAAELLRSLDEEIPVEPRKRTVFTIDAPNARACGGDAPLIVCPSGFWLRPEGEHWLCATVPADDGPCAADDFTPDHGQFEALIWPRLYRRAPCFDAVKVIGVWAGHYAWNRLDQNAILGPHPNWPNLHLMNGFSGHGLQQAPAVGRGIAEMILSGGWRSLDLSDLSVERVLAGRPFRERHVI